MPSKSRTTNANAAFNFRTIFITGCDQGIGLGLVKAMAKISCVEHIFAGCLMRDGEENIDSELKVYALKFQSITRAHQLSRIFKAHQLQPVLHYGYRMG